MKAVVIFSGGQDSTICLHWALQRHETVHAITFTYGQRHNIELGCAVEICNKINIHHEIIDIPFMRQLSQSALLHDGDISEKNEKDLPASFVPNRNQLFITLAHAYAQKVKAQFLVTGVCQTDYSGYPDCREQFIDAIEHATNLGSDERIKIETPLMHLSKAQTFKMAEELGVLTEVITDSHTCYEGDRTNLHDWGYGCGKCPACELRRKGFEEYIKDLANKDLPI